MTPATVIFWRHHARGFVFRRLITSASGACKATQPISKPTSATWIASIAHTDLQKLIAGRRVGTGGSSGMNERWEFETDGPDDRGMYLVNLARTLTGRTIIALRVQAKLNADRQLHEGASGKIMEVLWETNEDMFDASEMTAREVKDWVKFVCQGSIGVTIQEGKDQ